MLWYLPARYLPYAVGALLVLGLFWWWKTRPPR